MEGGASQQTGFFPTYVEFSLSVEFEVPDKDGLQSWGLNYMAIFPGGSQAGGCPPLREEGFPWEMNMWVWGHTSGDLHPSGCGSAFSQAPHWGRRAHARGPRPRSQLAPVRDAHTGGPLATLPCACSSPVPSSVLQGRQGGGRCSAQGCPDPPGSRPWGGGGGLLPP